jgi:hypothetical protein
MYVWGAHRHDLLLDPHLRHTTVTLTVVITLVSVLQAMALYSSRRTHKTAHCADSTDRHVPACLHIDSSSLTAVTNPIRFPSSGRLSQQTLEDSTTATPQPKVQVKLHSSRLLDGISDRRLYFQSAGMNWFCMDQGTSVTRYPSQAVSKYATNTTQQYKYKRACYLCSSL